MADSTRSSATPRERSWRSIIACRSGDTFRSLHVRRRGDAEVVERRRHHVGYAANRRLDADRQKRDHRVVLDERPVAAAPGVMTAAEVRELPVRRGRDEQL